MRIALTEYEAKHFILKALGLKSELKSRGNLYFLVTDHDIVILDTAREDAAIDNNNNTTGNPPQQAIPDSCFAVDGIADTGAIDYELEQERP